MISIGNYLVNDQVQEKLFELFELDSHFKNGMDFSRIKK